MAKYVKSQPITGATPEYGRGNPLLPNAADTSRDAQNNIRKAPMPFSDRMSTANLPAPTNPAYRANANFAKDAMRYGGTGKSVSVKSRPTVDLSAVGEPRLPKGYNPINSGFPLSSGRVAGRISTNAGPSANAKEVRRLRQTYPGLGIGKWRP